MLLVTVTVTNGIVIVQFYRLIHAGKQGKWYFRLLSLKTWVCLF